MTETVYTLEVIEINQAYHEANSYHIQLCNTRYLRRGDK